MDWPKFVFCVLIWVLCVSNALGDSTALISSNDAKCEWGDRLPRKDECNTCICFEGDVHCTNLPCRAGQRTDDQPECEEGQPVIKLDECNECFCFDGKLDCSDFICIRGSQCSEGQKIPRPDHCNVCHCFEGHIVCSNYECHPRSNRRPSQLQLADNSTADGGATTDGEIVKECEIDDYIPPPPPPFDCNKCVCLNHKVFCTMDSCNDDVPDINTRFNLKNEPNDNLEVYDKKISVDPYLSLFNKNYDKTPTKLVHTHAYNGFHQEIKVHSKNLSQDTSKLIKALASTLDNPMLGQIGENIKSSSSNINNHEPTQLSGGQAGQNYLPNAPYSKEIAMGNHSPNLSHINPLHSLSSFITSGSQSNETILVIPSKQKTFGANQQPYLNSPYSSESADLTFEQKKPYYSATHPSNNMSPSEHFKTYTNPLSSSRNKDLTNHSPLPGSLIHSEANNEGNQLSASYTPEDEPVSPSNAYEQVQHPSNVNKYSNIPSSHSTYNPSQDHLKFPSHVNDAQYAQPHTQLGPNSDFYRPYQNEPLQKGIQPIQKYNQYPTSQSQFDQNDTNPVSNQNMQPEQDNNYPRHPNKLNPINYNHYMVDSSQNEHDPNQGKSVFGPDNRGNNTHQLNAPQNRLKSDKSHHKPLYTIPTQNNNPTQMRLPENEALSTQDRNNPYLLHSKFEPNPSIYKLHPSTEPENGGWHNQESYKPHLTGYNFTSNRYKPEQDKNTTISDESRPHQFELNPIDNHNQFTPPRNDYQFNHDKQQPHSPFEPNQTHPNPNIFQTYYPNSPENTHSYGPDDHTQHYNVQPKESNLPQSNQEERLFTFDNKGNRYNVTNSHYKTHSSLTYATQYVPYHQGKTSDQSPANSNLKNSFKLHHSYPNSVEINGRGNGPDSFEYINQMNSTKPKLLPIQRESALDPTIVKVYQYLNQPKINYPLKHNDSYPHTPITNNYPGQQPKSLQNLPPSSISVEDDKNSMPDKKYPTNFHSQSLWDSSHKNKDKNPISYQNRYDGIPSYYSGKFDKNKVPINKPADFPVTSRYKTPSFQTKQYDQSIGPYNKDAHYGKTEKPLFQTKQYDQSIGPYNKDAHYGKTEKPLFQTKQYDQSIGPFNMSAHYGKTEKPLFQTKQYDQSIGPYNKDAHYGKTEKPLFQTKQYDQSIGPYNMSAHYGKTEKPLFQTKQYDQSIGPYNKDAHYGKTEKPLFQTKQYDQSIGPYNKDAHYGKTEKPLFQTKQYDQSIGPYNKDAHYGKTEKPLFQIKQYDQSIGPYIKDAQTTQYDKYKMPINKSPYSYYTGFQSEASPISARYKSQLHNSVQYDENKVPNSYNQYVHNASHPESSPIIPQKNQSYLNTLQHYKNQVPIHYNPYAHNISQPEVPLFSLHNKSSLWESRYNDKVPINYEPYARNISQSVPTQVGPYDKSPLLYAEKYDKYEVPTYYDPYGRNVSQPEATQTGSYDKSPLFYTGHHDENTVPINYDPLSYDDTGVPINNYGSTNHNPKSQHIYENINNDDIKLPETSPTSTSVQYDINKLPINENKNNSHYGYDLNLNDKLSTSNPDLSDQRDQSVDQPSQHKQPETGNFDDHGSINGFQFISNSGPKGSINKPNEPGTKLQPHPDASFLDERGSDGFQYKSPSDEDFDAHKDNLNGNKPAKWLLDDSEFLTVIPHKQNYANNSPYPKKNDPQMQFKFTQNSPVSVPGSQEESQKELKFPVVPNISQNVENQTPFKSNLPSGTGVFDDRGAHDGFQYISNSDEKSQNKPDHDQFKPASVDKPDNRFYPLSLSEKNKKPPSSKPEPVYPENDNSIIIDVDSINPDILKLLQNANKPLSIEDLINEIDSHKQSQYKSNNDSNTPTGLGDDNDQLQSRFDDLFQDLPLYPLLQTDKKITSPPPIDDSDIFSINELDPLELLRLLFPMKFNESPTKPFDEKDLLSLLLSTQSIYNLPKHKKPTTKEKKADKLPKNDDIPHSSPNNSKKKIKPTKEYSVPDQFLGSVDPRSKEKNANDFPTEQYETTSQQPSTSSPDQESPKYKQVSKVSEESRNYPPIQYPDVHIILHQRNVGDDDDPPQYFETGFDGNDFFPMMHPRIKIPKEQKQECGESSIWVRNCHACSCRGGQAMCRKIPDCVLRLLEEPMMCKPYSKFKMGSCYSCECNGDGIPECDASECKIESKNKDSNEDSDELTPPKYEEFFEDSKAKEMLSYYKFFKKLPKDTSDAINYPTCEPGTQWVSSCHDCECKENQKHECTKIEGCVLDLKSLGKPSKCKPNSQFYPKTTNVACQRCSCDDEGNPSCPLADTKK